MRPVLCGEGEACDPRAVPQVQGAEVRPPRPAHKDVRGLRDRVPEPRQARASVRPLREVPMKKAGYIVLAFLALILLTLVPALMEGK